MIKPVANYLWFPPLFENWWSSSNYLKSQKYSNIDKSMSSKELIFRLARLHFLILGFLLYLVGYLIASVYGAQPDVVRFLFGYLGFGLAHLSVSFSNDYFDRVADRNSEKTFFSGGSKVLVEHPELEKFCLKMAIFLLIASIFTIALFTFTFGYSPWLLVFGSIGGLTGWFYTAPPLRLAYRGLGEATTMLAVGFLMPGMGYFVAAGFLSSSFITWVFPLSCYGIFFIITVELPDLESDKISNKMNVVVRWGRRKGKAISMGATLLATISLAAITISESAAKIFLAPTFFLSILPLAAAAFSCANYSQNRTMLVKQVIINLLSMLLFIISVNGILLYQLFQ
jgi:1,4-dihydroxy-2-naphthoate octaprenyltransferase